MINYYSITNLQYFINSIFKVCKEKAVLSMQTFALQGQIYKDIVSKVCHIQRRTCIV